MTIKGGFGKIVLEIILQNKKYKGPVIYVGSGLRNFHNFGLVLILRPLSAQER